MAIFKNKKDPTNFAILTVLRSREGNILVPVEVGTGHDSAINLVKTVFEKGNSNILDWIANRGYLRYVDKEKAAQYLNLVAPIATAADLEQLKSATKIIKNFDNEKYSVKNRAISSKNFVSLLQHSAERLVLDIVGILNIRIQF